MKETKLFGKYNEFVLLILGFLFTGILGTFINNEIQNKTWEREQKAILMSNQTTNAINLLEKVSNLMNKRMYATWQLIFVLEDSNMNKSQIENKWKDYDEILKEWNTNRGFNREMLRFYFGEKIYNLERDIHYDLRYIGQVLECIKRNSNHSDIVEARRKAEETNKRIINFNLLASICIQKGIIGEMKDTSRVIESVRIDFDCKKLK
jgi:hypothetical protein